MPEIQGNCRYNWHGRWVCRTLWSMPTIHGRVWYGLRCVHGGKRSSGCKDNCGKAFAESFYPGDFSQGRNTEASDELTFGHITLGMNSHNKWEGYKMLLLLSLKHYYQPELVKINSNIENAASIRTYSIWPCVTERQISITFLELEDTQTLPNYSFVQQTPLCLHTRQ